MSRTVPVLFKPYMSRALLDGAKTETRRLGSFHGYQKGDVLWVKEAWSTFASLDKLKPTEIWKLNGDRGAGFRYEAGGSMALTKDGKRTYDTVVVEPKVGKTRVSLHLPTFGSRQTIVVEDAWKGPLLDTLTHSSAIAEGIRQIAPTDPDGRQHWGVVGLEGIDEPTPRQAYLKLWDVISGEGEAAKNPIVHCYRFKHFPVNFEEVIR